MRENDLRVVKTRQNIKNTLLSLLESKSLEHITVQDILDQALINRSTFYKHYTDKYAVAEELCNECFSLFCEGVEKRFTEEGTEGLLKCVEQIYQDVYQNQTLFLRLLTIKTDKIHLEDDITDFLKTRFMKQYEQTLKESKQLDYLSTLYACLVSTSIKWYLANGEDSLREQISVIFPVFQQCFQQLQQDLLQLQDPLK